VLNTCLALTADDSTFETIYDIFRGEEASLTVKGSLAEGWNSPAHLDLLASTYKERYFEDITELSE
jgi:hypothetical protein